MYKIKDQNPNKTIPEIETHSERVISCLSRKNIESEETILRILGAIQMLQGMEYHFSNLIETQNKHFSVDPFKDSELFIAHMNRPEFKSESAKLRHESIAYLNRIGQINEFIRSKFVQNLLPKTKVSKTLDQALRFRHFYSAHRQLDRANEPDSKHITLERLMCVGFLRTASGNIQFQLQEKNGVITNFSIGEQHQIIIEELTNIIIKIIGLL